MIDGDTVVLETGVKIRYLMMDAPETTNGHNDCYGSNASTFNTDLVLNKTVQLAYDVQCDDMYGRTLAYVTVDGMEVNSLMVERGYACVLHIPPTATTAPTSSTHSRPPQRPRTAGCGARAIRSRAIDLAGGGAQFSVPGSLLQCSLFDRECLC